MNPLPIAILVAILLAAASASAWRLSQGRPETAAPSAPTAPEEPATGESGLSRLTVPGLDDRATMARLDLARRHELLDRAAPSEIDAGLHAALDLQQAGQSARPCSTVSAALRTLEGLPSVEPYRWAIDDAAVPAPGSAETATDCDGLQARIDALAPTEPEPETEPDVTEPEEPEPEPSSNRRKGPRKRPTSKPPTPAPDPGGSVATKLDEELKPMGVH